MNGQTEVNDKSRAEWQSRLNARLDMGKELDLDDVAAQSQLAMAELITLRLDAKSLHNDDHIPINATYWRREAARTAKERDVMRAALEVSRGNVLSIKSAVGIGVITYDIWLREINTALGIEESNV
mgnify:CR=1 FL=1